MKIQTELTNRGRLNDIQGAPLTLIHSVSQCRRGVYTSERMVYVPVVDRNQNPLMPTTPSRARRWIKSKEATPFWKKGVFCIRLNRDPSSEIRQAVVVGIDPGSKKE